MKEGDICPTCERVFEKKMDAIEIRKVILAFKMLQGFEKDDKSWDAMYYRRYTKSAKSLVQFIGNWKDAVDCCQDIYEKFNDLGLTVTFETICKHAGEWKKDLLERRACGILSLPSNGSL